MGALAPLVGVATARHADSTGGEHRRATLVNFGIDASRGDERIHFDTPESLTRLVSVSMQGPPLDSRDRYGIDPRVGFPIQPGSVAIQNT